MRSIVRRAFGTDEVAEDASVDQWSAFVGDTFGTEAAINPLSEQKFSARLNAVQLGEMGLMWMSSSPGQMHSSACRAEQSGGQCDAFGLLLQIRGHSRLSQSGRDSVLSPGDMVLVDGSQPSYGECAEPVSMIQVKMSAEQAFSHLGNPDGLVGLPLAADVSNVRLASSIILSAQNALVHGLEDECSDAVSDIVLRAMRIAYSSVRPSETSPGQKKVKLRRRAFAYVTQNLADPDLSVPMICQALGTNMRYLQRLFLEIGMTPRQYILHKRLEAAAEQLGREGHGTGISDVAYRTGFSDLSYFIRSFHKKYGISPRNFRDKTFDPSSG